MTVTSLQSFSLKLTVLPVIDLSVYTVLLLLLLILTLPVAAFLTASLFVDFKDRWVLCFVAYSVILALLAFALFSYSLICYFLPFLSYCQIFKKMFNRNSAESRGRPVTDNRMFSIRMRPIEVLDHLQLHADSIMALPRAPVEYTVNERVDHINYLVDEVARLRREDIMALRQMLSFVFVQVNDLYDNMEAQLRDDLTIAHGVMPNILPELADDIVNYLADITGHTNNVDRHNVPQNTRPTTPPNAPMRPVALVRPRAARHLNFTTPPGTPIVFHSPPASPSPSLVEADDDNDENLPPPSNQQAWRNFH